MFSTDNEDVLVEFATLCHLYPDEARVTLWARAGGKVQSETSAVTDQLNGARVLLEAVLRGETIAPALLVNTLDEIEKVLTTGKPF